MALLVIIGVAQLVVLVWLAMAVGEMTVQFKQASAEQALHGMERQTIDAMFAAARRHGSDVVRGYESRP